jgi:hypothetical protein
MGSGVQARPVRVESHTNQLGSPSGSPLGVSYFMWDGRVALAMLAAGSNGGSNRR